MQKYVFDKIGDDQLHAYVVWGPMLGDEDEDDAHKATIFFNDSRSSHFWTDKHTLAEVFATQIGLEDELAWDVFLLYPPGVEWKDEPPKPEHYMHVGRSLPAERRLDGVQLREEVEAALAAATAQQPQGTATKKP